MMSKYWIIFIFIYYSYIMGIWIKTALRGALKPNRTLEDISRKNALFVENCGALLK